MSAIYGPWSLVFEDGDWYIRDSRGESIAATTPYYPWLPTDEQRLRLIAAAPMLLEALQALVDPHAHQNLMSLADVLHMAKQAVEQAKGQTK